MTVRSMSALPVGMEEPLDAPPRIAFYSHDTVGLGHTRRNLAVAASMISARPDANAVLITGNPEATSLWRPPHTDVVTLPTIRKDSSGHYRSRTLNTSLDTVVRVRAAVIEATVTSFAPDLLVVDKVPSGVAGELLPTLRRLRERFDTKIVLGLREILDDPVATVGEWIRSGTTEVIEEFYDAVWIYGDQQVFDPIIEYGLPAGVADRCVFTGYLAADRFAGSESDPSTTPDRPTTTDRPYLLCTVGGGQDGVELARTFARTPLPDGHDGIVVCGPFMSTEDQEQVHTAASDNPGMTVLDFVPELHRMIADAAAVVSMAGYNSVCEVLATDRPALLVPRTRPRAEQLVRARRLADLGAADLLPLDALRSDRLASWTHAAVTADESQSRHRAAIDVDGLRRLPGIAQRLLERPDAHRATSATRTGRIDHHAA